MYKYIFMTPVAALILIIALALPAGASSIVSWHPQVIDYIYVNDTINETIEYSITTIQHDARTNWTVDGEPVEGVEEGNTYYYARMWDDTDKGFHTVTFRGSSTGNQTEFRWYVNVYEIGGGSDGSIFEVIGNMLEDHSVELRAEMFRNHLSNNDDLNEFISSNVRWLLDEIHMRQMKRNALHLDFKNGNINFNEYVAAMKGVQIEIRYYMKLSEEMARIVRDELKNEELARQFENFSYTNEDWVWNSENVIYIKKERNISIKGNNKIKNHR